jgi:uncharacterized membrane protein YeaQ/YmgE (transglycosylase-associated protein family)
VILYIISLILGGLVVGALGRLLHPGRDPMSVPMTIGLGIIAMLVAGLVVRPLIGFGGGLITAVIVSVILVAVYARYATPGSGIARR